MPTYMTDTHSLLWAFTRPRKLGERARRAFEEIASGESSLLIPVIHQTAQTGGTCSPRF